MPGHSDSAGLGRVGPISRDGLREYNIYVSTQTDDDFQYIISYASDDNLLPLRSSPLFMDARVTRGKLSLFWKLRSTVMSASPVTALAT